MTHPHVLRDKTRAQSRTSPGLTAAGSLSLHGPSCISSLLSHFRSASPRLKASVHRARLTKDAGEALGSLKELGGLDTLDGRDVLELLHGRTLDMAQRKPEIGREC